MDNFDQYFNILKNHIITKKYWNVSPNCVEYILYYINIFQNTSPIRKDIPINQYTYSKLLKERTKPIGISVI